MNWFELFLIALGLSADAFAVALSIGLTLIRSKMKKALIIAMYFGAFQAGMPVIGYVLASWFAGPILAYGDWVAFGLLSLLGAKMLIGALKSQDQPENMEEGSVSAMKMIPLALATSIDAMAVGVTFAFIQVDVLPAASLIGLTTFVLSVIGVRIGSAFGARMQTKANIAGGIILILMGIRMLF